ncbi:MAG TPA: MATE family efflux transporter [Smithellaceae bacterium]|jgi:putative MATE family efflux protein|nr:MATE family efflux transporter [Syntrophaceae bacterium]HPL96534.1 MATE family efflux transporter [Smithellaceae bacterium]HPV48731.1 MATE family efflux transporter [Smithellaceae bacterium]
MQNFTQGNIARQFIDFTLPIMLGNVLMSVYGIINMIWVGRLLGPDAVAAVAASLPIIMLMPAFLIGLGMATNVLIAQAFGRGDTAMLKRILSNSFFASILFCLLISFVALLFRHEVLGWVRVPVEIRGMALSYMTVMMASLVFQFFINWMNGMLRGLGDATTVVKILILLALFNITFVPLCIRGAGPVPPLGVSGAAWGSALAAVLTGVIGYLYMVRYNPYINMRNWDYSLDWGIIKQVFVIGVPASLQMIVVSLAAVIIVTLVNGYGTAVTAAFGIGMQVDMLATIPFMSIGMAATTIAGQNLGGQKPDRVFKTLRTSIYFGLAIGGVCAVVLFFFSREIGSVFLKESTQSAQVLNYVRGYYHWMAFIFPCYAVIFSIQGVLRSAGDTMALLVMSFLAMFVIRIPLAYVLAGPGGFKQDGIWIAIVTSSALAAILNWLYYRRGTWLNRRIIGEQDS